MNLKEIKNKDGIIFPLICKEETEDIAFLTENSLEVKQLIEIALDNADILKILLNHFSTLSIFENVRFPLVFSINRKVKSELPFQSVSTTERTRFEHLFKGIIANFIKNYKSKDKLPRDEMEAFNEILKKDNGNMDKHLTFMANNLLPIFLPALTSYKGLFIDSGIKHRKKIIVASDLDKITYEKTIKDLEIKYGIIKPLLTIFWCENQRHDHYSFFMFTHTKTLEIKCPICNKNLSSATFYNFEPDINRLLISKEGFIQALILYFIGKTGRKWLPGAYLKDISDDTEKDIIVEMDNGYALIEIKNFAKDVNLRTKKENMRQLLIQSKKHLKSYNNHNITVNTIYLVFNYVADEDIKQVINGLLSDPQFLELKKINLEILGLSDIKKLEELKI